MRERVLAIVSLIAQYVMGNEESSFNHQELVSELIAVGFEVDEINDAFSWMEATALQPAARRDDFLPLIEMPSYRVYSLPEQQMLSLEARGFLSRVRAMGLLTDELQEEIIERALQHAEEPVSEPDIRLLTALSLLADSSSLWMREIGCVLDDNWAGIYH